MTFDSAFPAPESVEMPAAPAPWLPDRGGGTYRNPVLCADYSDPDVVCVGQDYWLTSSSFGHVPGLPILHSRDLVNWSLVNHALPRLAPEESFATPRHGGGIWAPSLRYHDGRYWLFFPDPDHGLFVTTAEDPRARWSRPVLVKAGRGLIDPCPLWDEDGTGYLVHAWAKSRSGIKNRVTLHRLTPDSLGVADEGEVVIDGDRMDGWHTIEGPKLYRRGEYTYIFAPAGGVAEGYQAVFRSRNIRGPYESRIVLERGSTAVNGPHQGAWVEGADGRHWFLHFQEVPAYGRVVHLQPVEWRNGWPVMGRVPAAGGPGEPVMEGRFTPAGAAPTGPATSDDFDGPRLGLQWQWQANPRPEWASLDAVPGSLRLACVPGSPGSTLWNAGHLLMQKFPAWEFEATARLDFSGASEGSRSGLVVFGFSYAWIGLEVRGGTQRLVLRRCDDAHRGGREVTVAEVDAIGAGVQLRVTVRPAAHCQFSYSLDGSAFTELGAPFEARSSYWVGAKLGVFAAASEGDREPGHADFAWFRVTSLPS